MNSAILTPAASYLICCAERTGSNLVTHALAQTSIAGRPAEYFDPSEQTHPWMREILRGITIVNALRFFGCLTPREELGRVELPHRARHSVEAGFAVGAR